MAEVMPNRSFIDKYLELSAVERRRDSFGHVMLPSEQAIIQAELDRLEGVTKDLANERASLAEQSGDSWHDGALNDSDRDTLRHEKRVQAIKDSMGRRVVDYPLVDETRVTLGSRVRLNLAGRDNAMDIVGHPALHLETFMSVSLEAPIIDAVLGRTVGEIALMNMGGSRKEITILEVDQESVRERFTATNGDGRDS